jgi:hypothetical protein
VFRVATVDLSSYVACVSPDFHLFLSFVGDFIVDTMKQHVGIRKKGVPIEVPSKTGDEGGFYLQNFLDNLYENKEKAGASAHAVLFGDENTKLILSKWEIVYDKKAELLAPTSKKDERGTIPLD